MAEPWHVMDPVVEAAEIHVPLNTVMIQVQSVSCSEANMIRCNCGGEAWVGGRPGRNMRTNVCLCGIQCTQCSPTPTVTTTGNPNDTPTHTSTPQEPETITGTVSPTNTATPTGTETNTPTKYKSHRRRQIHRPLLFQAPAMRPADQTVNVIRIKLFKLSQESTVSKSCMFRSFGLFVSFYSNTDNICDNNILVCITCFFHDTNCTTDTENTGSRYWSGSRRSSFCHRKYSSFNLKVLRYKQLLYCGLLLDKCMNCIKIFCWY